MDYKTARILLIDQGTASDQNPDAFLIRLKNFQPPIPGEVTNILLALKMLFESLQGETSLDRELVYALYQLAYESRQSFAAGHLAGINWPPLLDEDIQRIAIAVKSILAGVWQEQSN